MKTEILEIDGNQVNDFDDIGINKTQKKYVENMNIKNAKKNVRCVPPK